jgi:hypothetical protein
MLILHRTYTRPNTDTFWHFEVIAPTPEFLSRIEEYKKSGKIIADTYLLSEDKLELTFFMVFDNENSYSEYDSDTMLTQYWEIRKQYNDSIGIEIGPKKVTLT